MIDIHTHILTVWEKPAFTGNRLIKRMDELGIEKFVVLPITNPEVPYYHVSTEDVLKFYRRHPDRVIPFCNIDPRAGYNSPGTDFSPLLNKYRDAGCKGLGEVMSNLYTDDPLCLNLFSQCGEAGFPVLFHLYHEFGGSYGLVDDIKLPRLEKALKACPDTAFIGHAPAFWSEISADVSDSTRGGYPEGPVKKGGGLQRLFDKYLNLYGDVSAGSGFNALTRDAEHGYRFLAKYRAKLLFGTDICRRDQEAPVVNYFRESLKNKMITKKTYDMITYENARKLLKIK